MHLKVPLDEHTVVTVVTVCIDQSRCLIGGVWITLIDQPCWVNGALNAMLIICCLAVV